MNQTESDSIHAAIHILSLRLKKVNSVTKPISFLQRHMRLGYSEASAIIENIKSSKSPIKDLIG